MFSSTNKGFFPKEKEKWKVIFLKELHRRLHEEVMCLNALTARVSIDFRGQGCKFTSQAEMNQALSEIDDTYKASELPPDESPKSKEKKGSSNYTIHDPGRLKEPLLRYGFKNAELNKLKVSQLLKYEGCIKAAVNAIESEMAPYYDKHTSLTVDEPDENYLNDQQEFRNTLGKLAVPDIRNEIEKEIIQNEINVLSKDFKEDKEDFKLSQVLNLQDQQIYHVEKAEIIIKKIKKLVESGFTNWKWLKTAINQLEKVNKNGDIEESLFSLQCIIEKRERTAKEETVKEKAAKEKEAALVQDQDLINELVKFINKDTNFNVSKEGMSYCLSSLTKRAILSERYRDQQDFFLLSKTLRSILTTPDIYKNVKEKVEEAKKKLGDKSTKTNIREYVSGDRNLLLLFDILDFFENENNEKKVLATSSGEDKKPTTTTTTSLMPTTSTSLTTTTTTSVTPTTSSTTESQNANPSYSKDVLKKYLMSLKEEIDKLSPSPPVTLLLPTSNRTIVVSYNINSLFPEKWVFPDPYQSQLVSKEYYETDEIAEKIISSLSEKGNEIISFKTELYTNDDDQLEKINSKWVNSKGYEELQNGMLLLNAVRNGNLDEVKSLLKQHADPNITDEKGRTPLHLAARNGQLGILHELLNAEGVKPNKKDINGDTALHLAAKNSKEDTRRLMLSTIKELTTHSLKLPNLHSVNPTLLNNEGKTPLDSASDKGFNDAVKYLTNLKVSFPIQNSAGELMIKKINHDITHSSNQGVEILSEKLKTLKEAFANPANKNKTIETIILEWEKQQQSKVPTFFSRSGLRPSGVVNEDVIVKRFILNLKNSKEIKDLLQKKTNEDGDKDEKPETKILAKLKRKQLKKSGLVM